VSECVGASASGVRAKSTERLSGPKHRLWDKPAEPERRHRQAHERSTGIELRLLPVRLPCSAPSLLPPSSLAARPVPASAFELPPLSLAIGCWQCPQSGGCPRRRRLPVNTGASHRALLRPFAALRCSLRPVHSACFVRSLVPRTAVAAELSGGTWPRVSCEADKVACCLLRDANRGQEQRREDHPPWHCSLGSQSTHWPPMGP